MKFLQNFLLMPLLSMAFMFAPLKISAQEVIPHDWNDKVEQKFERDAPAEVVIWDRKVAARARDNPDVMRDSWANNYWLCRSETDPAVGACSTQRVWTGPPNTEIKLLFSEARSKMTQVLAVSMLRSNGFSLRSINSSIHSAAGVVDLSAKISANELKRLPAGGVWTASLRLVQYHQRGGGTDLGSVQVAETNAEITLHVTDTKNVQIFLPEYNTTTPTVNLGLISQVSRAGRTTGRRDIDMCLYDGFGSNSSWFDVTVKDDRSVPQRALGSFSVIRDGTSGQTPRERIDYGVTYLHNGQRTSLNNGETVRLLGGNNTDIRPVYLPNIPVPVLCKPMPLTLETPEFNAKDKQAGSYTGKLRIIFSPSAQSL
ncbi:CfaE/CblD family pilus tip adhesin [Burkholderia sp. AU45388]|uniref:CfaE/CblD family pilus tip adhesin n=1 Tax=Burkholderia sp. AU45388 TaxID=3059206 RepID=UPI00264E75FF|nr:CfaE/CblD family pilus tip adhesin [Burkholderia sp. AU45388]MDN7429076.1 CfaE/CblD family pilus tip adhesin [Burkholderia sp. AU45388]